MVDHREEITTIFVVGFPDDMLEREFQNMFTFCPEFEAAILKVPTSGNHSDGDDSGSAVTTNTRKQSIGFAKFRTRAAACEARNLLTGRRVDLDKNCVLKAEMAKKNLHAKRGLGSTNNNVHAPHHHHGLSHDTATPGYMFPTVSTAHIGKRFDPFCSSAPVTPLPNGGAPAGLGVAGPSTSVTTAADLFPPNDSGVFDFYPDSGLASLDNPSNFLQRRNSVHHTMLRDSAMSMGTSAPAARAIGFGLTKTQSERRNTNPASLNHIDQLFGTSAGSGSLLNSTMELGSLNNRLANLPLGGSSVSSSSITPAPGLPMSCSVPTKLSIPHTRSVNSNDQNPPCNTLYVGNLPVSTSEDELRALFSKAPGYKRLSFRPKPNAGPICFVEFEDIAHALQAMRDLDGKRVTHSNNGGIRLSFSKNPLGVRPQANPTISSSLGYPSGLRAATHTPPPTSVNHSSLFGSSFGSRHGSVLDSSLVMEPTSAAIH